MKKHFNVLSPRFFTIYISTFEKIVLILCGILFLLVILCRLLPTSYRATMTVPPDNNYRVSVSISRLPIFTHRLRGEMAVCCFANSGNGGYGPLFLPIFPSRLSISEIRVFWCDVKANDENKPSNIILIETKGNYEQAILIDYHRQIMFATNVITHGDQICTIDPLCVGLWNSFYGKSVVRIEKKVSLDLHWRASICGGVLEL